MSTSVRVKQTPTVWLTVSDSEAQILERSGLLLEAIPAVPAAVLVTTDQITGGTGGARDDLIVPRYDTAAGWAAAETGGAQLAAGELAVVDTDLVRGDGSTTVASLPRLGGAAAVTSVVGQTGVVTGSQILADTTVAAALAGKSATGHTHAATDLASGTVPTARLGSGAANSSTFLRGDNTWQAVAGGAVSSVVGQTGAVTGAQILADTTVSAALALKAPLASPTFTGTVTVPTPSNTTDAATKAYVDSVGSSGTPDADASTKGKVQLTTDLGGTAGAPQVVATHLASALPIAQGGTAATSAAAALTALGAAPLASPTLTGTPAAPTAAGGTNTTQLATTAYVQGEVTSKAPLASPTFTGTPVAPTATGGTNTTQVATTAFVQAAVAAAGGGGMTIGYNGYAWTPNSSDAYALTSASIGTAGGWPFARASATPGSSGAAAGRVGLMRRGSDQTATGDIIFGGYLIKNNAATNEVWFTGLVLSSGGLSAASECAGFLSDGTSGDVKAFTYAGGGVNLGTIGISNGTQRGSTQAAATAAATAPVNFKITVSASGNVKFELAGTTVYNANPGVDLLGSGTETLCVAAAQCSSGADNTTVGSGGLYVLYA